MKYFFQQIYQSLHTFGFTVILISAKRFSGNAKAPSILSSMIQEAHEIRENQSNKNLNLANVQGLKQNIAEESVSNGLVCFFFLSYRMFVIKNKYFFIFGLHL